MTKPIGGGPLIPALIISAVLLPALAFCAMAQTAGQLHFTIPADPQTFDPLLITEQAGETIRYLTGGVLIRFNRSTQKLEPALALTWKVQDHARRIDFELRRDIKFSDGSLFGPADVIATMQRIADPRLLSGIADSVRAAGGEIKASQNGVAGVTVLFSKPVAGLELLFDQIAISSARSVGPERAVLGPFMVAEHKGGQYVLLRRNPYYWKTLPGDARLPLSDSIRLDIQANRETELIRFGRGDLDAVDNLEPEGFERLKKLPGSGELNAGPSLDTEFVWFNQSNRATFPAYKKAWFGSRTFRRAISSAIDRDAVIRLVYRGYAHVAAGSVSPANKLWFNQTLTQPVYSTQLALNELAMDGFLLKSGVLRDRDGHPVEFSLITNAGSNTRNQIGVIIQQDLLKVGIRLNFVPVEGRSLVERITQTQDYEACLMGFSNVEIDPNSQMNIWMSSGNLHAWNPSQAKPATTWEAEVDRLMEAQHAAIETAGRKRAFDRVQEIVAEQTPIIFLVHPDVLVAVSPSLRNARPSALPPHLLWNIESLVVSK
jgi:peptide/nickel transport system substrate-binding protein